MCGLGRQIPSSPPEDGASNDAKHGSPESGETPLRFPDPALGTNEGKTIKGPNCHYRVRQAPGQTRAFVVQSTASSMGSRDNQPCIPAGSLAYRRVDLVNQPGLPFGTWQTELCGRACVSDSVKAARTSTPRPRLRESLLSVGEQNREDSHRGFPKHSRPFLPGADVHSPAHRC